MTTETEADMARFRAVDAALAVLTQAIAAVDAQDGPMAGLTVAHRMAGELAMQVDRQVVRARTAGVSWAGIGNSLGISRQTAFARYAAIDPRRWDGTSPRCAAAGLLEGNTEACEGEAAAVVACLDGEPTEAARQAGASACVRHGAELYVQYGASAWVYPGSAEHSATDAAAAAMEIYHRAQVKISAKGQA